MDFGLWWTASHSRDGLVVIWEPEYGQTNVWNLSAGTGEGETQVMYAVRKESGSVNDIVLKHIIID